MVALVDDRVVLTRRIDRVRAALADRAGRRPTDIDFRVAASVTHLGLVARLLAPPLGLAALGVTAQPFAIENLWWRDELGGPYPLSIAVEPATTGNSAVELITVNMLERYPVSPKVLWGNVGSAINGAVQMLSHARPPVQSVVQRTADALLADPRIDGGTLTAGPGYRRRSCCLIYRIAQGGNAYCGDCVLSSGRH